MVAHGKDLSRFSGEASGEKLKIAFPPKLPWSAKIFFRMKSRCEMPIILIQQNGWEVFIRKWREKKRARNILIKRYLPKKICYVRYVNEEITELRQKSQQSLVDYGKRNNGDRE